MLVTEIAKRAKKITDKFKTHIPVIVVDHVSDIPGFANSTHVAGGATLHDAFYLIRGGLRADKVVVTLFHEMLHFDLRRFLTCAQYMLQILEPYTKKAGQTQYFVRIKYVVRPQGEVAFSKSAAPAAKHISESDLWAVIDRETVGWHPDSKAAVIALATAEQLPTNIKDYAVQEGVPLSTIRGVIHKGKVYIVAGNIKSMTEAKETLLHESFGHGGMRAILGKSKNAVFLEVFHRAGGVNCLRSLARAFNAEVDFEGYIPKDGKPLSEAQQIELADELLAFAAGTTSGSLKMAVLEWVGHMKNALQTYFERKGWGALAKHLDTFTRADVEVMVAEAREAVIDGRQMDSGDAPMFDSANPDIRFSIAVSTVAPKIGPLDTPMRLAMQKTGAQAVWRGGFRVLEKTANAALDDHVGKSSSRA